MRALLAAASCLLIPLSACSTSSEPSMGGDGGDHREAGSPAGSVDASPDAFVDGATEGSEAGAGAEPLSPCFAPFEKLPDCETFSNSSLPQSTRTGVLLRAADLGEHVQFRRMGGLAIAASSMDDGVDVPVVIRLRPNASGGVDTQVLGLDWSPASGGAVELRDVWAVASPEPALGADVFALACEEGADCVVLMGDSDSDDTLRPMLGDSGESAPQGLAAWNGSVCIYGAGIRCHDGSGWTQRADDDPERLLRDMSVEEQGAVAVGDRGRIVVNDGNGFVAATTAPGSSDLHVASTHDGKIAAGSDQELLQRTESGEWSRCALDVGALVDLGPASVANAAGHLIDYRLDVHTQSKGYCAYSHLPEEPILSGSVAPCTVARNPMLLSASTLWSVEGTHLGCPVLP